MRTVCIATLVVCLSTLSISQAPGQDDPTPDSMSQHQGANPNLQSMAGGGFGGAGGAVGAFAGSAGMFPYSFSYSVNDPVTGNVHSRQESGDINGVVVGHYELIEPDGTLRIVDYTADANGFHPTITRIPNYAPPPPQPPRRVRSLLDTLKDTM